MNRGPGAAVGAATWITMIVVMAFVWGGFGLALTAAIGKERAKEDSA